MIRAWLCLLAACAPFAADPEPKPVKWIDDTRPFVPGGVAAPIADHYREAAAKIIAAARADRGAYDKLAQLTDRIGHRLSGSPELEHAVAWAVATMQADGLDAHAEKVMVPHWVRGPEDAAIVEPIARPLVLIGLGGTVATPKGGITAPVVVVHDWKELDSKRDAIAGSIVLYDTPMPPYSAEKGSGYGDVVGYRTGGPSRAAKYGAVGVLMRSVTAHAMRTPHTGAVDYDDKVAKIPAAAVTVEDAELIDRLAAKGPVRVHLHLESQQLPDAESANVIGELRGTSKPDEIVVIGGHLDSWDVGQGAHDDGAGVVMMMHAVATLKRLGLVPRRTIRVVAFTNEENGVRGGKAYAAQHQGELSRTVLALEADSGGFAPRGFVVGAHDKEAAKRLHGRFADLIELLQPLGATRLVDSEHGGTDIGPMAAAGVPQVGLVVDGRTYFDIHHTEADTLDKVDPAQLADDVAAVAVLAYIAADLPDRLDAP
ncbi:MAG TPA: M20/M25/M40 family metallo-hydrolase [Kofleriaceae bacterium]|nr:M20/M25/M40 family metallo-hydrolase [Kofleriaceae bacterium]